jgi:outer membrane protein OmpA-like peptidoglycan-associated protein/tetratricopeptide (TPR) repeat protein
MKAKCLFHDIFKSLYLTGGFYMGALLCLSIPSSAQSLLEKAENEFRNYNYSAALTLYLEEVKILGKPNYFFSKKIADCYKEIKNYEQAEKWYATALSFPKYDNECWLHYGEMLQNNEKFGNAKKCFDKFLKLSPGDSDLVFFKLKSCNLAMEWKKDTSTIFKVKNDSVHNTPYSEYAPVLKGKSLFFTSDRGVPNRKTQMYKSGWTSNPYFRIFFSTMNSGSNAQLFKIYGIDTVPIIHIGPVSFSKTADTVYFTVTRMVRINNKATSDPTSFVEHVNDDGYVGRLEIYYCVKRDGWYSNARPFKYNNRLEYSVGFPTLNGKGNILYFVSDMSGGYGKTDIYYCEKDAKGNWTKPQNAGPVINTPGKEVFLSMGVNNTLYFSSDGHPGMGGLDIFSAKGALNQWRDITNLKTPFNSSRDDIGYSFDTTSSRGYLSSNRKGGKGSDDIYTVIKRRPPNPLTLVGTTLEKGKEGKKILSSVDINLILQTECGIDTLKFLSDNKGKFITQVKRESIYGIKAKKRYYGAETDSISTKKINGDTIWLGIELEKLKLNQVVIIRNINYEYNKSTLLPESEIELNKIYNILNDNPEIIIELSSHTDSRGGNSYNMNLSKLRTEASVSYLLSKGIDKNRIKPRWYGETKLLNQCNDGVTCSEEEHLMNRRTEFQIIGTLPEVKVITNSGFSKKDFQ